MTLTFPGGSVALAEYPDEPTEETTLQAQADAELLEAFKRGVIVRSYRTNGEVCWRVQSALIIDEAVAFAAARQIVTAVNRAVRP